MKKVKIKIKNFSYNSNFDWFADNISIYIFEELINTLEDVSFAEIHKGLVRIRKSNTELKKLSV